MASDDNSSIISKLSQLLALYVVYVFLSGWSFLDTYFRFFGVNPRWLDIASFEILTKGFTILFTGREWQLVWLLWLLYTVLIAVPLWFDSPSPSRVSTPLRIVQAVFLVVVLIPIYLIAARIGENEARADKGPNSRLPSVTFTFRQTEYTGRLVFAKGGTYYVQHLSKSNSPDPATLQIAVFRAEEISEVKIVGFE